MAGIAKSVLLIVGAVCLCPHPSDGFGVSGILRTSTSGKRHTSSAPRMQFQLPKFEIPSFSMPNFQNPIPVPKTSAPEAKIKKEIKTVAVSGSSGLLGKVLTRTLQDAGITVIPITCTEAGLAVSPEDIQNADAVVHLAGASVAQGEGPLGALGIQAWAGGRKAEILRSRVQGTEAILSAIEGLGSGKGPRVLIVASGVGYYGYLPSEAECTEEAPMGTGFLASEVVPAIESAAAAAKCRVVSARFGVILSNQGGALGKLLPIFNLGGGGVIGSGSQYFSWVAVEDAAAAILHALRTDALSGPVNVCAPNPVTNAEFTSALGQALSRPTILPFPGFAVSLLFGQMGEEMLLGGQRAVPKKLEGSGFVFKYPDISSAIRAALTQSSS